MGDHAISDEEFIFLLLSLYRDSPELWDVNSQYYTIKAKRNIALQNMVNVLRQYRPEYDNIQMLKRKINILRSNFNKEYNKIQRLKVAADGEDVEPRLWYYKEMAFIKEGQPEAADDSSDPLTTTFVDVVEEETETKPGSSIKPVADIKLEPTVKPAHTVTPARNINPGSRMRRMRITPTPFKKVKIVKKIVKPEATQPKYSSAEEAEVLSKGWAISWSRLAEDQRRFAKKIISDVLFEGEMGTLTRNGVRFLSDEQDYPAKQNNMVIETVEDISEEYLHDSS